MDGAPERNCWERGDARNVLGTERSPIRSQSYLAKSTTAGNRNGLAGTGAISNCLRMTATVRANTSLGSRNGTTLRVVNKTERQDEVQSYLAKSNNGRRRTTFAGSPAVSNSRLRNVATTAGATPYPFCQKTSQRQHYRKMDATPPSPKPERPILRFQFAKHETSNTEMTKIDASPSAPSTLAP